MNYRLVNRLFTYVCFAFPPALGSLVSIAWHGGAIWCTYSVLSGRQALARDSYMLATAAAMYAYIVFNLASFTFNYDDIGDITEYVSLVTFFLFPFSYSIWTVSNKEEIARAAVRASMIACYAALVLAMVQFHVVGIRAEGGAGNALVFAAVTCLAGTVCLAGAFSVERRIAPYLLGAFAASGVAVAYSQSRVVWVAIIVVSLIVLWLYRSKLRGAVTRRTAMLLAPLCLLLLLVGFALIADRTGAALEEWQALSAEGDYDSSLGLRVALWETGLGLFGESPVLGHGMHSIKPLIAEGIEHDFHLSVGFSHFHNGVLTLLVESGIPGAACILAIFIIGAANAWHTLRVSDDETERFGAALLVVLLATFAISGSTSILIGHDILDTVFVIFLIVGTYLASGRQRLPDTAQPQQPPRRESGSGDRADQDSLPARERTVSSASHARAISLSSSVGWTSMASDVSPSSRATGKRSDGRHPVPSKAVSR